MEGRVDVKILCGKDLLGMDFSGRKLKIYAVRAMFLYPLLLDVNSHKYVSNLLLCTRQERSVCGGFSRQSKALQNSQEK